MSLDEVYLELVPFKDVILRGGTQRAGGEVSHGRLESAATGSLESPKE
jgi:hypothetical protein